MTVNIEAATAANTVVGLEKKMFFSVDSRSGSDPSNISDVKFSAMFRILSLYLSTVFFLVLKFFLVTTSQFNCAVGLSPPAQ